MKKNYQNIIIILIVSLILMLPFILRPYHVGHDTEFHIANIAATVKTMDDWIPDFILPSIVGNYGYGTRLFYPILPHTIVSYVVKLTSLSITNSLKIVHTCSLFLSGLAMYFLALKLSKNKKTALLSSIIYMSFPYHLSEIYVRDALNENMLFIFLPLIINGLTELFDHHHKFIYLFVLGYVGGILTHFTLMLYFTVLLIPFFIINYKKVFKKETILMLFFAAFLILAITSPSLVNMFQNKLMGNYRVFYPGVMAQGIQHSGLLIDFLNYFDFYSQYTYNNDGILFYLNIIVLILLLSLIKHRSEIKLEKYQFIIYFGLGGLLLSSIIFPWDILPLSLRMIQFPWRCLTFVALAISLIVPQVLPRLKIDYRLLIVAIVILAILDTKPYQDKLFDESNINYSYGKGWQNEYLPCKTYDNNYLNTHEYELTTSNGTATILSDSISKLTFSLSDNAVISIPRIYYPGYNLVDSSNNSIAIYEDDNGLIGSNLSAGTYTLTYSGTKYQKLSFYISLLGFIIYLIYMLRKKAYYAQD